MKHLFVYQSFILMKISVNIESKAGLSKAIIVFLTNKRNAKWEIAMDRRIYWNRDFNI